MPTTGRETVHRPYLLERKIHRLVLANRDFSPLVLALAEQLRRREHVVSELSNVCFVAFFARGTILILGDN